MAESSFLNPAKAVAQLKLHEGARVADFGAGSGFFTRAAARVVGQGGVVWAVDIHRDLLPRIKNLSLAEGLKNVEVIHGDIEQVGGTHLEGGTFDAVIAANVFFSATHTKELVEEIFRVLKLGGHVLIIDWQDSFGGMGPHKDHIVERENVRQLFERAGFAYVDDVSAGMYHWGLMLRKKARSTSQ